MSERIVLYTAKNGSCTPCEEITKLVEEGKFVSPNGEVDLVDITTDEGFDRFSKDILSKQDGGVPSAYLGGKKCLIVVEDGKVHFECASNALPSDLDEKPSPSETESSHDDAQPGPQDELPSPQE